MARKSRANKSRPKWATQEIPTSKTDKAKRLTGEGGLKRRGRGRED